MGTLAEKVNDYFASLNPLTGRIIQESNLVKKKYGDEWNNLSLDEQEEILDSHFIDPDVRSTYPQREDVPQCYPKLKINCGENIVADFDDGSMWRDEHSGPFSWYSLSQQDLTIPDPVEFTEGNAEDGSPKKDGKGKKKKKKVKKGKAPSVPDENNTDPELAEANTNMSNSEDGLKPNDTLNHSSLSPSKMSSLKSQIKVEEETKLLDSSFESGADTDATKPETTLPVKPKRKKVKVPKAAPPPPPVDKRWKKHDKETKDIDQNLMSEPVTTASKPPLKLPQDAEGGMVSGVFIHEVGESSTDPEPAAQIQLKQSPSADSGRIITPEIIAEESQEVGAVGGEINLALDEEENTTNNESADKVAEKPGFDFLLDW